MKTPPTTHDTVHLLPTRAQVLGATTSLLLALACPSQAAVLYDLNSTVLDGSAGENTFMVQNTQAGSGLSYSGGGSPSLTYTEGGITSFTYFLGYYTPVTLTNLNDSITFSFTLTASANAFSNVNNTNSAGLRIGLLNSGGSQITENVAGNGSTTFNNYEGYAAFYDPYATVGSNDRFKQRTASSSSLMGTGGFATDVSTTNTVWTGSPTSITGSFTLTRVADGLQITSVINGGTPQTVIDTSGINFTFDTFSFAAVAGSSTTPIVTFSDLTITTTVPEPSAIALLALGCGVILLRSRVKHRKGSIA
jgi:hypothetical protein